jgi:hypothetical protein
MNVGCALCFDNGWFASFVAKLFKMFGDNVCKFFFGIVVLYLQFVEGKSACNLKVVKLSRHKEVMEFGENIITMKN